MGTRYLPWKFAVVLAGTAAGCQGQDDEWVPIVFDDDAPARPKKRRPETETEAQRQAPDEAPTKKAATKKAAKRSTGAAASAPDAAAAAALEQSDVRFLRGRAKVVHAALLAALPAADQRALAGVPLLFDDRHGEVNAFASCTNKGAIIAVSDGLMQVQAQLARAQAADETFDGRRLDAYLQQLSRGRALLPPRGFLSQSEETHAGKRSRQAQLLDEGLAFVIGHELAHHLLEHTGCVGGGDELTTADVGRALASRVPLFNQPNELAADVYATQNLLAAGRSAERGWREDGALLMLRFFLARTDLSLEEALVFGFERTHPHPELRIPAVEQTAAAWRLGGGRSLPRLPSIVL
jgi:hypothetical protein